MECPICLEITTNLFVIKAPSPCNHSICLGCFASLAQIKCPLCRANWKSRLPATYKKIIDKSGSNQSLNLDDTQQFPPLGT